MQTNNRINTIVILSLFFLTIGTGKIVAQISSIGSEDYGRLFGLVYDPNVENKVFSATLNNHIMVSEDNGFTWEVFYSLPSGIINELRFVNDTHLSFYLSLANQAENNTIHLLDLSSLSLTTINRPANIDSSDRWIGDYSVFEANQQIMLYKEIYRVDFDVFHRVHYTLDGGQTWSLVYDEISNNLISIDKVLINYSNESQLFLTRGSGANDINGGFMVSNDAGASWTEYYPGENIRGVAVDPFDPEHWLIGTDPQGGGFGIPGGIEAVYRTFDAGENWSQLEITFDDYFDQAVNEIIFHPVNQGEILVLETNEIARSVDNGDNWLVQVFDPLNPNEYFFGLDATYNPFNPEEVLISSDWYPFRSTDGGITLSRISSPYFLAQYASISPTDDLNDEQDTYLYYGVQRGLVAKNFNTEMETTFGIEPVDFVFGTDSPRYFVDKNQFGRIFSFTQDFSNDLLSVSTDHGQTFDAAYITQFDPILHIQSDPVNDSEVWVAYNNEGTSILNVTDVDLNNPIVTPISLPTNNLHSSTWIDPTDNQNVLVGLGGEVWHSGDRGLNWTNVSEGLNLDLIGDSIFQIIQNPQNQNEFLIASSSGIWKSSNQLISWQNILSSNNIRKLIYNPTDPNIILAASYISGNINTSLFYSTDAGVSWTVIPVSDFEFSQSNSIDFIFTQNGFTAYIATFDLGVITFDVIFDSLSVDDDYSTVGNINFYPNPVTNTVNIRTNNNNNNTSTMVIIYDISGSEIKRLRNTGKIDVTDLQKGIYLVKISDNNNNYIIRKMIKK